MATRMSCQESTSKSPNRVMLGREITLPVNVMIGTIPEEDETEEMEYAAALLDQLQSVYAELREKLNITASRQKNYFDSGV